jgi:glucose/mannose-6-phosphate isomerase
MITENEIRRIDSLDMFDVIRNFPSQVEDAIKIGRNCSIIQSSEANRWVIVGIGGSAIAGDLLQTFFRNSQFEQINISVNRNYDMLIKIDYQTNVVISSYSGNTEETLEAYTKVKEKTQRIIGITSGGKLEELLQRDGFPVVKIPDGYQPRAAIGYSFFSLLLMILRSKFNNKIPENIEDLLGELVALLKKSSKKYAAIGEDNPAIVFAQENFGKMFVIYGCEETLYPLALRFRAQLQENAKNLAFSHYIPEMNHNEINSYEFPPDLLNRVVVVLLSDRNDYPRNKMRIEATEQILSKKVKVVKFQSSATSFLARLFDLLYFFDWCSFYLAIHNGVDPTQIPTITQLKTIMQT